MGKVRARRLIGAALAGALGLAFVFHHHSRKLSAATAAALDQGCVNQGEDRRLAATVICGAQQRLSWKSEHEPHFVLIGRPERTSIGLAWPPYFVYNSPAGGGQWRMFRIGFRYDRGWRGYIFPTIAWKLIPKPLRY
jgi:alkanesulfonate monooxygenase SsuD/methylene tetrahydromethanopterin reductase-like flavin-dependent oxidoreductase (luciferase family)